MACDVATFRTRFPEFGNVAEYSDARIELFIADAVLYMGDNEDRWCSKYDLAQCYLSAHLLSAGTATEAGDASANAGPVSQKSAGGVSLTKAVVAKQRSDADEFYSSTSYGMQYLNIRNSCFVGVAVANYV